MPIEHDEMLTADELHGLLRECGVSPTQDSPLWGLPPPTHAVDRKALAARGLLDPAWRSALEAIRQPSRCFRTIVPMPDRFFVQAYYPAAADGAGAMIGCWAQSPHIRFRFPCTAIDLLRESSSIVLADLTHFADPLAIDLTPAGLAAMAATVDALRQGLLEAILTRQCRPPATLDFEQLRQVYAKGLAGADSRWLVTLLRTIMPASIPLPGDIDAAGLSELAKAGVLDGDGSQWRPGEALVRLATWWKTPLPAIAHELISLDGGQLKQYGYLIAIRGDGPPWLLEFWRDGEQPVAALRCTTGSGYRRALGQLIGLPQPSGSPGTSPAQPVAQNRSVLPAARVTQAFCARCGAERKGGGRFCTACGDAFHGGQT